MKCYSAIFWGRWNKIRGDVSLFRQREEPLVVVLFPTSSEVLLSEVDGTRTPSSRSPFYYLTLCILPCPGPWS